MSVYSLRWKWECVLLLILLVGCDSGFSSASATAYPVCTPATEEANLYRNATPTIANKIYQFAQGGGGPIPVTGDNPALIAKRESLKLLKEQIRKWSAFVDVPISADYFIRITLTLISPQMIEGVVTSQILYSEIPVSNFSQEVLNGEEQIAKREELLFLLMLTANEYRDRLLPGDRMTVKLPIQQMTLSSSSNEQIPPRHKDHHLEEAINLRFQPEYGYLAYPLAVLKEGTCHVIVDKVYTTTVTIHIPDIIVNDVSYGPQTWNIEYQPLVKINAPEKIPDFQQPLNFDVNQFAPMVDPPSPINGVLKSDNAYWDDYWSQTARFIWYHLTGTVHQ